MSSTKLVVVLQTLVPLQCLLAFVSNIVMLDVNKLVGLQVQVQHLLHTTPWKTRILLGMHCDQIKKLSPFLQSASTNSDAYFVGMYKKPDWPELGTYKLPSTGLLNFLDRGCWANREVPSKQSPQPRQSSTAVERYSIKPLAVANVAPCEFLKLPERSQCDYNMVPFKKMLTQHRLRLCRQSSQSETGNIDDVGPIKLRWAKEEAVSSSADVVARYTRSRS